MIVEGTHVFAGRPEAVWDLLLDPTVIAKAMPGTRELVREGPDRYRGRMQISIGPITAAEFALQITLADLDPPRRFVMHVDGTGRFGFTRGAAEVTLAPEGEGTAMGYRADLQVAVILRNLATGESAVDFSPVDKIEVTDSALTDDED